MRYSIDLLWSEEDAGYVATIPELFGIRAFGETAEQAAKAATEAAENVVSILVEDGDEPPPPQLHSAFSGQLRLRIPKSIHQALSFRARADGVSLNTLINSYLARQLGICEGESGVAAVHCPPRRRRVSGE